MLQKRIQHIEADRLLELIRAELLIGPCFNPGFCRLTLTVLLKAIDQVAQPAAQHTPRTRTRQELTQLAEHATQPALLIALADSAGRLLLLPADHFGDFAPILITRDSKKSQQCNHGRHSSAHFILL